MENHGDYLRRLSEILGDYLRMNDPVLTENTNLLEEFDLSSYDLIELVIRVEEEFGIRIPDASIRTVTTAGKLCELIDALSK